LGRKGVDGSRPRLPRHNVFQAVESRYGVVFVCNTAFGAMSAPSADAGTSTFQSDPRSRAWCFRKLLQDI